MNENSDRVMEELLALPFGPSIHPHRLADDTVEIHPSPAATPEFLRKVAGVCERAGMRELRPGVWGVAEESSAESPTPDPDDAP